MAVMALGLETQRQREHTPKGIPPSISSFVARLLVAFVQTLSESVHVVK